MNVLILTNGDYGNYEFCKYDTTNYDYIICADRGTHHARRLHIKPDLIVGDFDSGFTEDIEYYRKQAVPIKKYNPIKDETDTAIAIQQAIEKKATFITVYGGIGSRLDHSLGNVHLLYPLLQKKIKGCLMNPHNIVYMTNQEIVLEGEVGDLVSLIPFAGEAKGVTTYHLGYPLTDATLKVGSSLGISNVMTEKVAKVTLREGTLLVIKAQD